MELKNKQLIIIGGGSSLKPEIEQGLWKKLENKFTLGLNFSYHYFKATAQIYVDLDFFNKNRAHLSKLPLVIGKYHRNMKRFDRLYTIKASNKYDRTLKNGCYKSSLVGIYSTSLAIFLEPSEIFLLGFDYGGVPKIKPDSKLTPKQVYKVDSQNRVITHFYQDEIIHRGSGRVNYYESKGRADRDFSPFKNTIPIWNVSECSKITVFPKISYNEFYQKLDDNKYNQDELRQEIKKKITNVCTQGG